MSLSISISEQIKSLGVDLQGIARNPSQSKLEELQVRVESIQGHVTNTSDIASIVRISESIQALRGKSVSPLRSSATSSVSVQPKSPPKVLSVKQLKETFDLLVKADQSGKLTPEQALLFQELLTSAKKVHIDDPTMDEMEVGTEILVTLAIESSSKKGRGPQIRFSAFTLNDHNYHVNLTRGDGACAMHALLGTRQASGIYQFAGNPRKHYTDNLVAALKGPGNAAVKQTFTEAVSNHFTQANRDRSSRMLFGGSVEGRAINAQWNQLHQDQYRIRDDARALEATLWKDVIATNHNGIRDDLLAEVASEVRRVGPTSEYYGQSQEQILAEFDRNPSKALGKVATNSNLFYGKIAGHKNADTILAARNAQQRALTDLEVAERHFIHSDRVVNHYVQVANNQDYYFNTAEIHVAALLFGKKVQVVGSMPGGREIVPTEYPFNAGANGELTVIHHRGAHFSRCVLDDARGAPLVQREEGKKQESQLKKSASPVISVVQSSPVSKPIEVEIKELIELGKSLGGDFG